MASVPSPRDDEHHDEHEPKQKRERFSQLPHVILFRDDLSDGEKVCYAVLDSHWRDGEVCRVKQKTLALEQNVSVPTVQRRSDGLAAKKLVEVKRLGLTQPNEYRRLPLRHLQAVPDDTPDTSDLTHQEASSVTLHSAVDKGQDKDRGKDKERVSSLNATSPVVRCMQEMLLPILQDLHEQKRVPYGPSTGDKLERLIRNSPHLHEGHIAHVCDRFTGNVPDRRFSVFDVDAITNPARFAYAVLAGYEREPHYWALPATYEALCSREEQQ